MAAFDLLDRPVGPVIADFPEDAPESATVLDEDAMTGMVCPIALPALPDETAPTGETGQALMREVSALAPWYDLAVRTRGRTTVGPSGLTIDEAAKYYAAFLEDQETLEPRDDLPFGRALKLAYEDIKAYYSEAITAQPGYGASRRVDTWLYTETVFGRSLWNLREICRASKVEYLRYLGQNSIIPDRQINPARSS